ncbi:putative multidrug resistance protein EmrK [compost metagenome]
MESIAPATGVTFAAVKPDNATGNFTKVVQRIPVKIMLEPGQPLAERLRVGMSVEASIDTGSSEKSVREVTQR